MGFMGTSWLNYWLLDDSGGEKSIIFRYVPLDSSRLNMCPSLSLMGHKRKKTRCGKGTCGEGGMGGKENEVR